jgi:hypothetical protein
MGMQNTTTTKESSMESPQKQEIEIPYDPLIALLGIYPKECKARYSGHLYTNVHHITVHNRQVLKKPRCSTTDDWIKKLQHFYSLKCYSAVKKNFM